MTQNYLDHLKDCYPNVEKWHFTSNEAAFEKEEDAKAHAKTLADDSIMVVANGGNVADALPLDHPEIPVGETAGEYMDDTPTEGDVEGDKEGNTDAADADTNTTGEAAKTDADNAKKGDAAAKAEPVDYSAKTVKELKEIATAKGIAFKANAGKAVMIELLNAAQ